MSPTLQILGSSSAIPTRDRNPTAQVLRLGSEKILIDCGEGTQMRLLQYGIRHTGIDYICISHLHGDHYFGLVGLISTMSLMGRKSPLHIIGPAALKKIIELQLVHGEAHLNFELKFYPTNPHSPEFILKNDTFQISSFPLQHKIHCTGFLIKEMPKLRILNTDAATKYNIPIAYYQSIKTGKPYILDNGTQISNEELTHDPLPPKSYAYCSDTLFDTKVVEYIQGSTMLYHEATYLHQLVTKAAERYHSTAKEAGIIAAMAKVNTLLIGHFSTRYENLEPLLAEAKTEFENTFLAKEGNIFEF